MRFENKVAIVTGAAMGLGRAISEQFAAEGAAVVTADISGDGAQETASAITAAGGTALAVQADVASWNDVQRMTDAAIQRFGRIDILVNNAGIRYIAPFLEMDIEAEWQRTFNVNLNGPMYGCRAVIPHMLKIGRGKIVNMASTTGILALTKRSAYAASKAGLIGLTKALAFELSRQNIWVNAVAPGVTKTPVNASAGYFENPTMLKLLEVEMPIGRFGEPHEPANAVLFLASDESDFICGETLVVDGGWCTGKGF